jgi:hypothetical protein
MALFRLVFSMIWIVAHAMLTVVFAVAIGVLAVARLARLDK